MRNYFRIAKKYVNRFALLTSSVQAGLVAGFAAHAQAQSTDRKAISTGF
jgi:hypothetical protein